MAARVESAGVAQTKKEGARGRTDLAGYLFIAPFMLAYAAFLIFPVLLGLRMSFFNASLVGADSQFLGFANYRELFGDPDFWGSLWHTILFTLLSTPPLVILALIFALLANRAIPARWFFRLSFFAPWVLPSSVVALIWVWLYQPGFGLINGYLVALGLPEVAWLPDESVAMFSVVIATVWWTLGFNFILYLAGLQEIPQDIYDAAATDGAGPLSQIRWITIPLLTRTTLLVLTLQIFASLNVFDQIYIMNTTGGLNYTATRSIIQYVYEQGFTSYRVGFASAMSYVFFMLVLVVGLAQFAVSSRRRENA
ncbi:MAG: ABC transporter, permease protein 1 (cluster 1, maltose/g3p/polyamine/iron) [uncultured Rubrobacteraceae bacterium]|uniref:ABC transporter, permease protein 1 (Cluster 1, maltose/g3p/polyamine/iron) n=1 Tax=uncultured Rubrobacteraceae bacterium TaxID=349277 RepID=A0A6J4RP53_9ACTN|nr:MAG: ABC transporter, permease protein 1 (cluster 1, maltose/g3p/polyamine/iron) [uncultured Rubrobacteraceae bacterium]